jgi:NAD(P)-dependent dehydrogenase (short-subunit alcohol dehydrogenase family)
MQGTTGHRFDGKTALVTGAGRGLGRAFALGLAREGADVAVTDIDAATAARTADEVRGLGRRALAIRADAASPADAAAMVAEVSAAWGKLDVAVNNAGISLPIKEALAVTEEEWDRQMDLTLRGTFFCAQAEARAMIPRRSGRIVNIASICGTIVWPEPQAVYSASKAGLIHLTRCLAAEWAPHGIGVNCVSPGVTRTPELFPEVIPVFLRKAPVGRVAETDDMVEAVLYLASDRAGFLVGHNLVVDGGYTTI